MKLLIYNNVNFHYEIVINAIEKYDEILKIPKNPTDVIYVHCLDNISFINYIKENYPLVIFENILDYDYCVNCTIYMPTETINDGKHFYISHTVCNKVHQLSNVYHLMPTNNNTYFKCDVLPFNNIKTVTDIPIYVIQGAISARRRDFSLLAAILEHTFEYDYKIKILGHGKLGKEFDKYKDKLIVKSDLNFIDYHTEFADIYAILPLVSKSVNPLYYKGKLTSSINYGVAYNLKFIVDNELNNIYNLENAFVYTEGDASSLISQFKKSLITFYNGFTTNTG